MKAKVLAAAITVTIFTLFGSLLSQSLPLEIQSKGIIKLNPLLQQMPFALKPSVVVYVLRRYLGCSAATNRQPPCISTSYYNGNDPLHVYLIINLPKTNRSNHRVHKEILSNFQQHYEKILKKRFSHKKKSKRFRDVSLTIFQPYFEFQIVEDVHIPKSRTQFILLWMMIGGFLAINILLIGYKPVEP